MVEESPLCMHCIKFIPVLHMVASQRLKKKIALVQNTNTIHLFQFNGNSIITVKFHDNKSFRDLAISYNEINTIFTRVFCYIVSTILPSDEQICTIERLRHTYITQNQRKLIKCVQQHMYWTYFGAIFRRL